MLFIVEIKIKVNWYRGRSRVLLSILGGLNVKKKFL